MEGAKDTFGAAASSAEELTTGKAAVAAMNELFVALSRALEFKDLADADRERLAVARCCVRLIQYSHWYPYLHPQVQCFVDEFVMPEYKRTNAVADFAAFAAAGCTEEAIRILDSVAAAGTDIQQALMLVRTKPDPTFEREDAFKKRLCEWRAELGDALRRARTPAERELLVALARGVPCADGGGNMFALLNAMHGREVERVLQSVREHNVYETLALTFWKRGAACVLDVAKERVGDWFDVCATAALTSANKQDVPWDTTGADMERRFAQRYSSSKPGACAGAGAGEALCLVVMSCLLGMKGNADVKGIFDACMCWLLDQVASEQPLEGDQCAAVLDSIAKQHADHPLLPCVGVLRRFMAARDGKDADVVGVGEEVSKLLSSCSDRVSVEVRVKVLQCYFAIAERHSAAQKALQAGGTSDLLWALAHQFAREEEFLGRPLRYGANPQAIIRFMAGVVHPGASCE